MVLRSPVENRGKKKKKPFLRLLHAKKNQSLVRTWPRTSSWSTTTYLPLLWKIALTNSKINK